jgi:hypothetical protein
MISMLAFHPRDEFVRMTIPSLSSGRYVMAVEKPLIFPLLESTVWTPWN